MTKPQPMIGAEWTTIGSVDAAIAKAGSHSGGAGAAGVISPHDAPPAGVQMEHHAGAHPGHAAIGDPRHVMDMRALYWHNVVREMLNGLSMMSQSQPEVFDGRFALLTHSGERIAIRTIFPLFACSIPGSPFELEASIAVQCSVYRVVTPEGEVFTLPLQEVRGLHSLTQDLVEQLQAAAEAEAEGNGHDGTRPFGLAAFTSLTRANEAESTPDGIRAPDAGGAGPAKPGVRGGRSGRRV